MYMEYIPSHNVFDIFKKNALSIFQVFVFTSFLQNDEDMLIPPGPNTKTKDDILPLPEILELIDVHVSEVNLCDFKEGEQSTKLTA